MQIKDNVVDLKLLKQLQKDSFWETTKQYNWWDGEVVSNPVHELIVIIFKDQIKERIAGFEWWSNYYPVGPGLNWHNDKDEEEYKYSGKIIKPLFGCIFYPKIRKLVGGYLEIAGVGRYHPIENRAIIFNSGEPHQVTPIKSGYRRAIAINVWKTIPRVFRG